MSEAINWNKIKVGDTIKVETFHYREGRKTVTRKVVEVSRTFGIGIRCYGWNPFYLRKRSDRIVEHIPASNEQ